MSAAANTAENGILDAIFQDGVLTAGSYYVGLSTTNPGDDGSGLSEPSTGSYARVEAAPTTGWNAASGGSVTNNGDITFPEATGSWGTVTHWTIWDASAAGNLLFYGTLSTAKAITNGDTPTIADGTLQLTCD